jgi:hypothetical protein
LNVLKNSTISSSVHGGSAVTIRSRMTFAIPLVRGRKGSLESSSSKVLTDPLHHLTEPLHHLLVTHWSRRAYATPHRLSRLGNLLDDPALVFGRDLFKEIVEELEPPGRGCEVGLLVALWEDSRRGRL